MTDDELVRAVDRYMALPYRVELIPDEGGWFVRLPELPGCMSQGETPEEALAMIRDAQRGWLTVAVRHGDPIPEPVGGEEHHYTGRFNVRVPKDVHRSLVAAAETEGVSLNLYVATVLARAVAQPEGPRRRTRARTERTRA
jgi:antitoxin HicB